MAGSPRRRARREAELLQAGVEPAKPVDNRPMKKPPNRDRSWEHYKERGAATPVTPRVAPAEASDDGSLEAMLSAVTVDGLDAETNQQFASLRAKAFSFASQIMDLPLEPDSKNFIKVLSVKQAITTAVLTATTRVRPGDLRDKDEDGVGLLLEEVRRQSGEAAETVEERDARLRREMLD